MTRRQSNNQWSGSIAAQPAPKIPTAQIRWKISRLEFFGSRRHHPYLPKGQTINAEYYTSLLVQLKDIFKEKRRGKCHQGGLVLVRQCPGSPGTCNSEVTGLPGLPPSWSPTLFTESSPFGLPHVPWTEKNNWKVAIFLPTRRSLLTRRRGWTDNVLNFFLSGLQKLEQRAKKCIEFRGEYVE